ncbi:hypothetical protein [Ciceribacter thiooxidans]|uniref:Transmembrane protein n=1 Tax=Ciceribacter thiooxidans TaxID=1969821 RepID=A0ABV7HXW0_9HYPH|nr:hypothetical protein [Ciceribacter thiooxidans]MDI6838554.1 hypothetical protein [Rhizobiaceae bacterium]
MRRTIAVLTAVVLSSCTATPHLGGPQLEPVPGSITYGGQPRTKLTKAPVGSTFEHRFQDRFGRTVIEVYRIEQDRSLTIVRRYVRDIFPDF